MQCIALVAFTCGALAPALAAEITALRREQRIGARVQTLDFPESLRKDLVSGLTNRLLVRVTLMRDTTTLEEAAIDIAVRFDLWDEVFHIVMTSPAGVSTRVEPSIETTLRVLDDLHFGELFDVSSRPVDEALQVHADILLNPIDRERMDKIRQWVAENTTSGSGSGQTSSRTSGASSELFARIFEQYAAGKDVAAVWRRTLVSRPFRLDELADDAR